MMTVVSIIVYVVALYLILKFVKNDILEVVGILLLTILIKVMAGDGSFYPLFAMPVLLALRYKKPYVLAYTTIVVLFVSYFQGFGSWTYIQLAIYGVIALGTYTLKNILNKQNKLVTLSYNFVVMFMFGVLMDIAMYYTGNFLGYPNVFAEILAGIPFDVKYGMSGLMYGSITMAVTYLSSVNVKEILKVKMMTLEKIDNK